MFHVFPLWVKTPQIASMLMPDMWWKKPKQDKTLYLTFDDGPIPEATPFVLEQLGKFNAKATFFCIGNNILRHPQIFEQVKNGMHSIGNHTMHHQNGWNVSPEVYLDEAMECQSILERNLSGHYGGKAVKPLFRPPYGKIKPSQFHPLKSKFQIVMWDIIAYDFDVNISGNQVAENVINNAESGSIVVLHDSLKAYPKLQVALPKILQHFSTNGWRFEAL